jgi:hypothetical protein
LTPVWVGNELIVNTRVGYTITPNLVLSFTAQQLNASQLLQAGAPPIERRFILSLTAHL